MKKRFYIILKNNQWPLYPNYDHAMGILFYMDATGLITHILGSEPCHIEGWALESQIKRLKEIFPKAVVIYK